jgi:hypothetical protein
MPTMLFPKLKVRCAMWVGGVYRSLDDVTRTDLVREIAGRHGWKIPEDEGQAIVDRWVHSIAAHADDTPTGLYVASRAEQLLDVAP